METYSQKRFYLGDCDGDGDGDGDDVEEMLQTNSK